MSITTSSRTTVTLDHDVLERVQAESRSRGASFRDTLNDLLRLGLLTASTPTPKRTLRIRPLALKLKSGVNYDDIGGLIAQLEGEDHR